MNEPESGGMLETGTRVVQTKCFSPEQNLSVAVPYFNQTVNSRNVARIVARKFNYSGTPAGYAELL